MGIVGLRGDRVRLVPSEASLHLENAQRRFNDPELTAAIDQYRRSTRVEESSGVVASV